MSSHRAGRRASASEWVEEKEEVAFNVIYGAEQTRARVFVRLRRRLSTRRGLSVFRRLSRRKI